MKKIIILFVLTFSAITMNAMDTWQIGDSSVSLPPANYDEILRDICIDPCDDIPRTPFQVDDFAFGDLPPLFGCPAYCHSAHDSTADPDDAPARTSQEMQLLLPQSPAQQPEQAARTPKMWQETVLSSGTIEQTPWQDGKQQVKDSLEPDSLLQTQESHEPSPESSAVESTSKKHKSAVTTKALAQALGKRSKRGIFECEQCHKILDASNRRRHMKVHSDEKQFICPHPECGKSFKYRDSFERHIKIVHDKIKHSASKEGLTPPLPDTTKHTTTADIQPSLDLHQSTPLSIQEAMQLGANFRAVRQETLVTSEETVTPLAQHDDKIEITADKSPLYALGCAFPDEYQQAEPSLDKPHKNENPDSVKARSKYACPICSKRFGLARKMNEHLARVHKHDLVYCPVPNCGHACTRRDNIQAHTRRIHGDPGTGEKLYCTYPGYGFYCLKQDKLCCHSGAKHPTYIQ